MTEKMKILLLHGRQDQLELLKQNKQKYNKFIQMFQTLCALNFISSHC